jgi:Arginine methyltransferase oligomerization subdomain/Methyltransferase domain
MVFDGLRNAAYARALQKVIGPTTTVMDLGAGLGVHGLNAARLGAGAVHLVEPSPVIEITRQLAADNKLTNVHCHAKRAEELQLAEQVDVIVSVFTGNFLLTEDLLPSLFYARDKFLAPGGRMLPDRARMEVVPVTVADYYQKHVDEWSSYPEHAAAQGEPELDYSAVRSFAANTLYYDSRENFKATPLAAPAALMELDFTVATSADCDSEVELHVDQGGTCHGWLGWFQMHLVDEWLSTSGDPQATHWSPVFLPLEQPLQLEAGDRLGFALKRPEFGEWTWTTQHHDKRQRQSTFLSEPVSPERMRRSSENYQPGLNEQGEAARWLLARMAGEESVSQLATQLIEAFPAVFPTTAGALKFVKDLARNYS